MNYEEEGKKLIDEAASAAERAEVRAHLLKVVKAKRDGWSTDDVGVAALVLILAMFFSSFATCASIDQHSYRAPLNECEKVRDDYHEQLMERAK